MFEIIHVVDPHPLPGEVRHNLEIEVVIEGPALAAGYYFVLWPAAKTGKGKHHQGRKLYFGPFATRAEARLMHQSALSLGLIPEGTGVLPIAECRSIVSPLAAALPGPRWQARSLAHCPA